jgi:hypothetical protein
VTTDYGRFAPPADRSSAPYVRCPRCQVPQPVQSAGPQRCVACGAPLQRWVAHPPPGGTPAAKKPPKPAGSTRESPYAGPPAYRGGHPQWAFPPVIWRDLPETGPAQPEKDPAPALRWAAGMSLLTAVAALTAAGAEIWRFVLMLEGRTLVLSGTVVRASDVLVAASGLAVLTFAVLTAAFAVPALVRAHHAAARRLGFAPSRSTRAIVARLLIPVWNVFGAGQIATEIARMLRQRPGVGSAHADDTESAGQRPSTPRSWVVQAWWLSWIVSAVLIAGTLARGLGGSLQAIADTVELHIAVDLVATVVAGLGAVILLQFARGLTDRTAEYENWVVQPPAPTRPLP